MGEGMSVERAVIGVDLGGTNLRAAVIHPHGVLSGRQSIPTRAAEGADAVVARMARLVTEIAGAAGLDPQSPVGVASPGPLNPSTGIVHFTPNLPGWRDFPLRDRLQALTGRPVMIENDANCAALGEARFGIGRGARHLIYLGLGTGVGGGVIANGRLVSGAAGLGGELGHMLVSLDGPRCSCGSVGCLEAYASGWAIARESEFVAATADGAAIRDQVGDGAITASAVAAAAQLGDPAAQAILDRAGTALGAAIGSLVNIFNPELVVIGGGLATLGDVLLEPARHVIPRYSFRAQREAVSLVLAALGDDSGLFGAGAIAMERVAGTVDGDGSS
jgi:glucokinase